MKEKYGDLIPDIILYLLSAVSFLIARFQIDAFFWIGVTFGLTAIFYRIYKIIKERRNKLFPVDIEVSEWKHTHLWDLRTDLYESIIGRDIHRKGRVVTARMVKNNRNLTSDMVDIEYDAGNIKVSFCQSTGGVKVFPILSFQVVAR